MLFISYCIILHVNNSKPTFAPPSMYKSHLSLSHSKQLGVEGDLAALWKSTLFYSSVSPYQCWLQSWRFSLVHWWLRKLQRCLQMSVTRFCLDLTCQEAVTGYMLQAGLGSANFRQGCCLPRQILDSLIKGTWGECYEVVMGRLIPGT